MYKLMQLSNIKLTRVLFDVVYTKDTDKTKGNRLSHYMQSTLINGCSFNASEKAETIFCFSCVLTYFFTKAYFV